MEVAAETKIGPLTFRSLHPKFAAEVFGVHINQPLDDETFAAVEQAFLTYGVLVFRGQDITDEQQLVFTHRFGELQPAEFSSATSKSNPHVYAFSNLNEDGKVMLRSSERMSMLSVNERWHTDNSFWAVPPSASILSARRIPSAGGDTFYASMTVAYDELPTDSKIALADLKVVHDYRHTIGFVDNRGVREEELATLPPAVHPLVRTHPQTGAKSLYVSSGRMREIVGMPAEKGRALAEDLVAWTTRPAFIYRHQWRRYDAVMWDNRCMLHRAQGFSEEEPRVMHRTTGAGEGPVI